MKSNLRGLVVFSVLFLSACAGLQTSKESISRDAAELNREAIRETVKKNLPQLEPCYLDAIEKRPGAEGKIILIWRYNREGQVTHVEVKEAGPKIEMAAPCVMEKVKGWTFPQPSGNAVLTDVEVVYPFVFSENGRLPKE